MRLQFFTVTTWDGGEPGLPGDEHTELRWLDIATACSLPELATPGYRSIFQSLV